jgi:uncharacterized membrane protein required for colicin V production
MGHFALKLNWFDFVVLLLLAVGVLRGRKRGMSEEVLDLVKWILIVIAAAYLYQPLGEFVASVTPFSNLTCYIALYASIALVTYGFFAAIRRAIGQKLVTSDAFGEGEYYMGMVAGGFRYFCVLIVCLAFLNARLYNAEKVKADDAYWEKNLGSGIRPPSISHLQLSVFENSFCGGLARNYLAAYMIRPTAPEDKPLGGGKAVHAREKNFNEVLEKK